jgi:serine protease inhibitor
MRKPLALAAAAATVMLATAACGTVPVVSGPPLAGNPVSRVPYVSPRPYGAADLRFGLALLGAWCQGQPRGNFVFSPASLATGLGLAYLGARGQTAAAMARTLHLPSVSLRRTEAGMRAGQSALGRLDAPGVTLAASNRVWSDPSLRPRRSYLDAAALAYHAGLSRVPLLDDPTRAAQIINAAVARDTHGKIPRLLEPGALTADAWVLTDALSMSANWARPFPASRAAPGPFTTAAGGTATGRFMHGAGYRYATAGGWTAVALPYRGGRLTMTALLPPAGSAALRCQVPSAAALRTMNTALARTGPTTGIALPTVSLGSQQDMNGLLTRLGMGIAFGAVADFTGLSPRACCISLVEQAATLRVGEKGTVGSAATAVGLMPVDAEALAGRQIVFSRPYLMLVTDTATGEPLFLARVADPGG